MIVKLENCDEPGQVLATVCGPGARAWALDDQTIDGSSWEVAGPGFAYAILSDRPGLEASLESEGYDLDAGEYCEGDDETE